MTSKNLLVLANSIRHAPSTCLAGRELLPGPRRYRLGQWIRPISSHGEGELAPRETRLFGGHQPRIFSVIQVPLARPCGDLCQPENWLISPWRRWKTVKLTSPKPRIRELIEQPRDLWLQPGEKTDRVSAEFLKRKRPTGSLRLIVVHGIHVSFGWNPWNRHKKRSRVRFTYRGVEYRLALTDPVFSDRYQARFPARGQSDVEFDLRTPGGCALCLSLASEYNGYHHKIVATILDPRDHAR